MGTGPPSRERRRGLHPDASLMAIWVSVMGVRGAYARGTGPLHRDGVSIAGKGGRKDEAVGGVVRGRGGGGRAGDGGMGFVTGGSAGSIVGVRFF